MSELKFDLRDGVAVLTMTRGVANTLSPAMRAEMADALERAAQNPAVQAVVLTGAGPTFSGGVELTEFDRALAAPWIDQLTAAIDTHPKPVVAAMQGNALGAGFELALAAHRRVAQKTCRLALPEVTLGLIPSGGATQRLPRLLGAQVTLEIVLSGQILEAQDPKLLPLFEKLTEDDPLEAACALARDLAGGADFDRIADVTRGFSDPAQYQKAIRAVRATVTDEQSAEADIVSCVEAAQLLPYAQGLAFEAAAFEARMVRPGAHAARYVYTAERRAGLTGAFRDAQPRKIERVVICGEAPYLRDLAVYALDRGLAVTLLTQEAAGAAFAARIAAIYQGAVSRGVMPSSARDARLLRLQHTGDRAVLERADLVMDASGEAGEAMDFKTQRLKPGVIWARLLRGDGGVPLAMLPNGVMPITVRPYRPCHTMPFVEIAVRKGADPAGVAALGRFLAGPGHKLVLVSERKGLMGHELAGVMQRAGLAMLRAGLSPQAVEVGAKALGFGRGPLEMIERDGIGVVLARMEMVFGETRENELLRARAEMVVAGKTPGQGFYAVDGHALRPDPGLQPWLDEVLPGMTGAEVAAWPTNVTAEQGFHAALLARGVRLWRDGVIANLSDVDLCLIKGYGFDPGRGGPMHLADQAGLLGPLRVMKVLRDVSEDLWAPPAHLEELVKYGQRLMGTPG